MNRLLTVAILAICTVPLYAQSQPPNATELAQTVFGIIAGDKTKTQTYCQVLDLSDELDQVDQPQITSEKEYYGALAQALLESISRERWQCGDLERLRFVRALLGFHRLGAGRFVV